MHKLSMNVKENHVVLQHLEIEELQQLQACAPSQLSYLPFSVICPTPSH